MDKLITSIAHTFIVNDIDEKKFLENYYQILNGFDSDSKAKLILLIRVLNFYSTIRYFKPFKRIDLIKRDKIMKSLFNSPISKIRGGINGLRALNLLTYYSL